MAKAPSPTINEIKTSLETRVFMYSEENWTPSKSGTPGFQPPPKRVVMPGDNSSGTSLSQKAVYGSP